MKKLLFLSLITTSINSAEVDWKDTEISFQDLSQPIHANSLIDLSAKEVINLLSLEDALASLPNGDLNDILVKHWYHKNKRLIHNYANRIDASNLESITITKNPNLISVYKDTIVIVSNNDLNNQVIKILDLNNNQIIQEIKTPHEDEIVATEISKKYVATISDSQVNIWNIKTGKLLSKFKPKKISDQKLDYKKFENDKLILCYRGETGADNINIFDIDSESNFTIRTHDYNLATTFNNILILVVDKGFIETWNINDKSFISRFYYSLDDDYDVPKGFHKADIYDNQLVLTLIHRALVIDIKDIALLPTCKDLVNLHTNLSVREYITSAEYDKDNDIEKVEVSSDKVIILGEDQALDIFDNKSAKFIYRISPESIGSIEHYKIYKNWIIIADSDGFSIWNIYSRTILTRIEIQINDLTVEKNHLIIKNDNGVTIFNLEQPTIDFLSQYSGKITFKTLIESNKIINFPNEFGKKRSEEEKNSEYRKLRAKLDNFETYLDELSAEDITMLLEEQQMVLDDLNTAGPAPEQHRNLKHDRDENEDENINKRQAN